MRKLFSSIALLVSCALLFSCGAGGGKDKIGSDFKMRAVLENIGEKLEVNVTESEYASGIYWIITADSTEYFGENGEKIRREDLKIGDTLEIYYSGQVMMSYPPQIVAARIERSNT